MEKDIRYDEERIGTIFSDIQRYLKDFEGVGIHSVRDLDDKRNFYASSMILFSLLNRVFPFHESLDCLFSFLFFRCQIHDAPPKEQ
jgi:hypothetical protein